MNSHKGSEFKCEATFNSHKEFNDYVNSSSEHVPNNFFYLVN
jgi:hypothetical protein